MESVYKALLLAKWMLADMVYSFIEQWGEGKLKRLADVIKKLFEKNGSMTS